MSEGHANAGITMKSWRELFPGAVCFHGRVWFCLEVLVIYWRCIRARRSTKARRSSKNCRSEWSFNSQCCLSEGLANAGISMKCQRKLFHSVVWFQHKTQHLPKATPTPLLSAFREQNNPPPPSSTELLDGQVSPLNIIASLTKGRRCVWF